MGDGQGPTAMCGMPTGVSALGVQRILGLGGYRRAQIERLQVGLNSRYAERNPLGPPDLEGTVWDMFRYLAGRLAPKPALQPRLRRVS